MLSFWVLLLICSATFVFQSSSCFLASCDHPPYLPVVTLATCMIRAFHTDTMLMAQYLYRFYMLFRP